ncbi:hypothetical protein WDZ92_41880 [Nostoc sp. NIES-2111]
MANASKTHMGPAQSGKDPGNGAMTDDSILEGKLEENMLLSNRDKSLHSDERGLDGKAVQTEQFQDHSANHLRDDDRDADRDAEEESGTGQLTPGVGASSADGPRSGKG